MMIGWYFPSLKLYLNGCTLQNLNDSFHQFQSDNYSLSLDTFPFTFFSQSKGQRKLWIGSI